MYFNPPYVTASTVRPPHAVLAGNESAQLVFGSADRHVS